MDNRRNFLKTASAVVVSVSARNAVPDLAAALAQQRGPARSVRMSQVFRDLLRKRDPFENVAVSDVLSARMAEVVGLPSLYLGSSGAGEAHGLPDWGLLSLREQVDYFGRIAQSVTIPAVADVDVNSEVLSSTAQSSNSTEARSPRFTSETASNTVQVSPDC